MQLKGKHTTATIYAQDVEPSCLQQIQQMVDSEPFNRPIAVMCDCHAGKGSVVGFTMPLGDKLNPETVGVDVGCGILSANLGQHFLDHHRLVQLDQLIRARVPMGMSIHEKPAVSATEFPYEVAQKQSEMIYEWTLRPLNIRTSPPRYGNEWFMDFCGRIKNHGGQALRALGTLGGGNHFIELGVSEESEDIWLTIHSGSRRLGLSVCKYWSSVAIQPIIDKQVFKKQVKDIINDVETSGLPKETIAHRVEALKNTLQPKGFLEGPSLAGYLYDMVFAQLYASLNRKTMLHHIVDAHFSHVDFSIQDEIECVHNYIDFEDAIIRKGATKSYKQDRVLIPFNMRDGILVCQGKSNPEWNYSAPHGAGRVLSRTRAKAELSLDTFINQMRGVYSTSVCSSTLDEAPGAYKDAALIEHLIQPTATVIDKIVPIHNLKAL